jgi:hypothetical protein
MRVNHLIGLFALTLVATAGPFVSAQSTDRTSDRDQRLSAPTKGGVIVGTPGDSVMSPSEKAGFEETTGGGSTDSVTAIEYGLIASVVP